MTERLDSLFTNRTKPLLSVFYTAGYPECDSTMVIAKALENAGVDFIELGIPFSDPIADGPVIQASSFQALANGVTVSLVIAQVKMIRESCALPILLMGYLNPVLQYGVERFLSDIADAGADGVIFPDLPFIDYERKYRFAFEERSIAHVCMITPQTSEERIRKFDGCYSGFLYAVSSPSITGAGFEADRERDTYLNRLAGYNLKNPLIVGFGISDQESFQSVTEVTAGAIVGSAFLRHLNKHGVDEKGIAQFVHSIRGDE